MDQALDVNCDEPDTKIERSTHESGEYLSFKKKQALGIVNLSILKNSLFRYGINFKWASNPSQFWDATKSFYLKYPLQHEKAIAYRRIRTIW